MTDEKLRSYENIMEYIDQQLSQLNEDIFMAEARQEWDKFIPGLREIELNEKGELVSFVAESKAKDFQNH